MNFTNTTIMAENTRQTITQNLTAIAQHNGYIKGLNQGFTQAAQKFQHLLLLIFIAHIIQLIANAALKKGWTVPILWKYVPGGSTRIWKFLEQASWSASFFAAIFMAYGSFCPIGAWCF